MMHLRDKNWRKWPEYRDVIAPLVEALKKRGHAVVVGKGFWQKDFNVTIGKHPTVDITVTRSGRSGLGRVGSPLAARQFWLVLIGDSRYGKAQARARFPEPKVGFDFARMAVAVEERSSLMTRDEALKRERAKAVNRWRRDIAALPKQLREYNPIADHHGQSAHVDLRCATLDQLIAVLKVARKVGIEP